MRADVLELLSSVADGDPPLPVPLSAERESREPVPTGRLRRLFALGSLQARIAAAHLLCRARETFATEEERRALRSGAHMKSAMRLLDGAGYLRGMVTKAAQALSLYPELTAREYADTLDGLHFEAPAMHFSLLREQVRRDLGGEPEELFAHFETRAFAAASLGQVHAARLPGGEAVAVKVQYPGVARAIDADTGSLLALLAVAPFVKDRDYEADVLRDVRVVLLRETDYRAEARTAQRVRAALAELDDVVVPRVHERYSGERVLTLELLRGRHLDGFLARHPDQATRDRMGELVVRVISRLYYSERTLLADPGPGNFLFREDGRLGVLDFGCYRDFAEDEWAAISDLWRRAAAGESLDPALLRCARLDGEREVDPEHLATLRLCTDWYLESVRAQGPFDFGDDAYLRRGMEMTRRAMEQRHTRQMPGFFWQTRCFQGMRILLHRLGARVDHGRIDREEAARGGLPA